MNKTLIIIEREYLTRVRKKSFIILSLVAPLLFSLLFIIPIIITKYQAQTETVKTFAIHSNTGFTKEDFPDTEKQKFKFVDEEIEVLKLQLGEKYYAILKKSEELSYKLISDKQIPITIEQKINNHIKSLIKKERIATYNIDQELLNKINPNIKLSTVYINQEGKAEKSSSKLITIAGFALAFIIYMFIFMYGAQVMRGVIDEKTNRVVEVIISSVKPFQLMMGKIVGVALVALTQVAIWVGLSFAIFTVMSIIGMDLDSVAASAKASANTQIAGTGLISGLQSLPVGKMIITFVIYFIGGYLLYTSLFAAVGSAVDSETDTQQFMLPISIPLVIGLVMAQTIITNPESDIAFWGSMIPFTSPIIMVVRVGFGVETWELILSMTILILSFIATTWIASRIYRIGILMYGKKVSYRELFKWIKQSN